jgi:hypothetical protein
VPNAEARSDNSQSKVVCGENQFALAVVDYGYHIDK